MHGTAPEYLTNMFTLLTDDPGRHHLCSAARGDIDVPRTNTKTLGRRGFVVVLTIHLERASDLYPQH